jgi:hypothetical protein
VNVTLPGDDEHRSAAAHSLTLDPGGLGEIRGSDASKSRQLQPQTLAKKNFAWEYALCSPARKY